MMMMDPPRPRRQGRPPSMPDPPGRILDEAAALFAARGFDGASLGDLAEAVGMTKAAIYHYFPSKQDIYEAIIVRVLHGLAAHVTTAIDEQDDPRDRLRAFMTAHAGYFEDNFHGFATMLVGYGGMKNPSLRTEAKVLRRDYESRLREIIAAGIGQDCFVAVDPALAGRAILSMLNWMVRWFQPGGARRATDFANEYCDLILGGMLHHNAASQG